MNRHRMLWADNDSLPDGIIDYIPPPRPAKVTKRKAGRRSFESLHHEEDARGPQKIECPELVSERNPFGTKQVEAIIRMVDAGRCNPSRRRKAKHVNF